MTIVDKSLKTLLSLLLISCCLTMSAFGQQARIDSLELVLSSVNDDSLRVDLLAQLARLTYRTNLDQNISYNEAVIAIVDQQAQTSSRWMQLKKSDALGYIGLAYRNKGQLEDALRYYTASVDQKKVLGDSSGWARNLNMVARIHRINGRTDLALNNYQQAYQLMADLKDTTGMAINLNDIGYVHKGRGDLPDALQYYLESLALREATDDKKGLAIVHNHIGFVYEAQQAPDKALPHFEKSLAISEEINERRSKAVALFNIGKVYQSKGEIERAMQYYNRSLAIEDPAKDRLNDALIFNNLGNMYLTIGQLEQARDAFRECLLIRQQANDKKGEVYALLDLTDVYLAFGQPQRSLEHAREAHSISQQIGSVGALEATSRVLSNLYETLNDHPQALRYYKQYVSYKDSVQQAKNVEEMTRVELRNQFEKQRLVDSLDQAATLRQAQLELEAKELRRRRRDYILYGAFALLLFAGGLWYKYNTKKQQIKKRATELALQNEREKADSLRELDSMKSKFITNLSHEIRTPLTLLLTPLQKMVKDKPHPSEQKQLGIMQRNGQRLLQLIDQMLELSTLEAGKTNLQVQAGSLDTFLRVIFASFESVADRQQIDFQLDLKELPDPAYFDSDKTEKIIVNLLSNAFKYTPDGERITLRAAVENKRLRLEVEDSGPGIAMSEQQNIFDRFHQVDEKSGKGSGIGLALSKELATALKGNLSLRSEPGQGSTFILDIPVDRAAFAEADIVSLREQPVRQSVASDNGAAPMVTGIPVTDDRPMVLVIEDNADLRHYIEQNLQETYKVVTAADGKLGWEQALHQLPDLIVSDVMMPGLNGTELCERIKTDERTNHIPVILLTARARQEDRLEGIGTGADVYLTKPFDLEELQLRIRKLIEQRRQLRERYQTSSLLSTPTEKLVSAEDQFMRKVIDAIEQHLSDEQFSVEALGRLCNMSRSQLHRKLTAICGQSPSQLIRTIRLERARQLLENGTGSVSEIAYEVGFKQPNYFSKCFADAYGYAPSALLK